jgi:hypothetical protein
LPEPRAVVAPVLRYGTVTMLGASSFTVMAIAANSGDGEVRWRGVHRPIGDR